MTIPMTIPKDVLDGEPYTTWMDATVAAQKVMRVHPEVERVMLLPEVGKEPFGGPRFRPEGMTVCLRCRFVEPADWHIVTRADGVAMTSGKMP